MTGFPGLHASHIIFKKNITMYLTAEAPKSMFRECPDLVFKKRGW